ncbi:CYTH and CHAD domain-containing protein [Streptomyces sp. H10-C2]|uniref:CYTH and CHAD domain-containing protein n=1 Tax=unclassified Streptomyces TaxID=2593676 RepID=UPI0024BAAF2B|nr:MULTISPECIES: CYTH and CHAD domain-containing protein [unclassified Streptomyces]MDJ0340140.1 CYTH and CHAD domain-containing protein [Streptomyces sp. PH10-H1]MDJ0369223.1 CYTH and CHAD domain-containing protein [Streptomyces sp. H10-C2]
MGKRVRETERKYEADGRFEQPDLSGLSKVFGSCDLDPAELDAVYFDTADLRLAARRITLRRRTGGDDAGWHLKLPTTEADTRTEVHAPLGRATRTVPKDLAAEVAVHTRGQKLVPVVRLKNHRERRHLLDAAGEPLAEIAHDHVTAQLLGAGPGDKAVAITWTEFEVELIGGKPALLDAVEERLAAAGIQRSASSSKLARALGDRLTAAPVPPEPPAALHTAGDAALAYLHEQLRALIALDPEVRRAEPDAVHQMRVAARRMRSALKSFRGELDRAVTDPLGEELKWLGTVLGMERDREVLAERLAARLAELDPSLAGVALRNRLLAEGTGAHGETHAAVVRVLGGSHYFSVLDAVETLLADPPYLEDAKAPAPAAMEKAVHHDHRRLRKLVEAALALGPGQERDVALHEARKAAKRARYCAEAAQPVLGAPEKRHTSRMKSVQSLLGEHQDSVMCRVTIARLAEEAVAAGESAFPYGALSQLERARATEVEEHLPQLWEKADRWP